MRTIEEIEARKAEIRAEVEAEGADLSALDEEVRALNAEAEEIRKAAEMRAAIREGVAAGSGAVLEAQEMKEEKSMTKTIEEVRASQEYLDAWVSSVKKGDEREARALLTELASEGGQLPVPAYVDSAIQTAWERNDILRLVRKTYYKGILKVGYEFSATGAVYHAEGSNAPDEEELLIGTVALVPVTIKKWITISTEAMDMDGEAFVDYVVDEITQKIAEALVGLILGYIGQMNNTPADPSVPEITIANVDLGQTPSIDTVAKALGGLSAAATNPVVVINRKTWAAFKGAQYAGNFNVDPFEGLPVYFSNVLADYDYDGGVAPWIIVGDFGGVTLNYPNGDDIKITVDPYSLAEADLVKIVGRIYVGVNVVKPNFFAVGTTTDGGGGE